MTVLWRTLGSRVGWLLFALVGIASAAVAAPRADLWPHWDVSDEASPKRVEHDAWQALLDRYLVVADDGRTLFRYAAVTDNDRRRLDGYLDTLAGIDPRTLRRSEQFAYWVNLYNALTVQVVLDHPGRRSIRRMGGGLFRSGPWRDERLEIDGQGLSLDDIEHRILRPIWRDHRIHYVVNCASLGCPDLLPAAFTADNLEDQLQHAEQRFLSHPRAVAFENGRLRLSRLFDWYRDDFADSREGLLAYLGRQRPDLAESLTGYAGRIDYHYDWALNDAP